MPHAVDHKGQNPNWQEGWLKGYIRVTGGQRTRFRSSELRVSALNHSATLPPQSLKKITCVFAVFSSLWRRRAMANSNQRKQKIITREDLPLRIGTKVVTLPRQVAAKSVI